MGRGGHVIISRCWNGSTIEGTNAGGIVGSCNSGNKIYNCYNKGNISGFYAGGIAGIRAAEIVECYNEGTITASMCGGGIIGANMNAAIIDNCYNTADVSAEGEVGSVGPAAGGLLGYGTRDSIANCYSTGQVSGSNYFGCLVSPNVPDYVVVVNSYYLNTCTESEFGEPKSEDYMRSQEFVDYLNGRDTELVWALDEDNINDGFPILAEDNLHVEESPVSAFNIYPNPALGKFTVEGKGVMTVCNVLGQTVLAKEIDGQTNVALPSGMYFVKLGTETQKVVVK